jgi:hypothetical protein
MADVWLPNVLWKLSKRKRVSVIIYAIVPVSGLFMPFIDLLSGSSLQIPASRFTVFAVKSLYLRH